MQDSRYGHARGASVAGALTAENARPEDAEVRAALERHGGDLQETADELGCGRGYVATVRDRLAAAYRRLGTDMPAYLMKKPGELSALRFRHVPRVAFRMPHAEFRQEVRPTIPPEPVRPVVEKPAAIPVPVAAPAPKPVKPAIPKPAPEQPKPRLERKVEKVAAKLDKVQEKVAKKVGRPKNEIRPKHTLKPPPFGFVWADNGQPFPSDMPQDLRPYNVFVKTGGSLVQSAIEMATAYAVVRRMRARLVAELARRRLFIPEEFKNGFGDDNGDMPSELDVDATRDRHVCPHTHEQCDYWRTCEFNHVFANRADACENNLGSVPRCTKCGKWQSDECEFKCFRKAFEERTGKRLAFGLDTSGRTSAKRSTGGVYSNVASDPYAGIWR